MDQTRDVVTLADVEFPGERHALEAAMRARFVLGFSQAEWSLAWRLYTTRPYPSAIQAAKTTFDLVAQWAKGEEFRP